MRIAVRLLMLVMLVGPLLAGPSLHLSAHERPSTLAADDDLQPYAPADAARLYTYAPDGSLIAGAPELGPTALCTYAVPTGETVACADLDAAGIRMEITDISWSPDSRFLAFAERTLLTFQDGDLWTMDARTGALTNVTDDGYEGDLPPFEDDAVLDGPVYADVLPRWSPDSSRLAFSRTVVGDPDGLARSELWTVDLATGDDVRVATVAEDEIGALYFNLAWSPDSATIYASLFHRANDDPDNGIWAFDVASGTGEQLVGGSNEHFLGFAPAVLAASPRGDYLAIFYPQYIGQFQAEQGGYALFDLERGEVVELPVPDGYEVDTPVRLVLPGFSPDGASVIYGVRRFVDPPGAIALLDLDTGTVDVLADLPDGGFPIPASLGEGIRIAENGVAFVLTSINTGVLIPVQPLQGQESTPAADSGDPGSVIVGGDGSEIHATPSFDAPIVLEVGPGDALDVIGEPVTNDEGTWIPVRDPKTRTIGYILRETLSE